MYSLSVLAKLKNWNFIYYVSHISTYIKNNPDGNYKYALDNGMKIIEDKEFNKSNLIIKKNELFISEGGAIQEAKIGIKILANEINSYIKKYNLQNIKVFLPSGTGTTALFLNKYLEVDVLTCSCVGDDEYLKKQFFELQKDKSLHPTILKKEKKFHFGKLYKSSWDIWNELNKNTNIEFDLLYDPIGWQTILYNKDNINIKEILYIHQGGLKGNITMKKRYERKYLIDK
jgi:1-aminocyclopropane-1-carboxylate deaminase/D-cysteine desulfhydrase-like pyridoxal-dependent ACC family enzyme